VRLFVCAGYLVDGFRPNFRVDRFCKGPRKNLSHLLPPTDGKTAPAQIFILYVLTPKSLENHQLTSCARGDTICPDPLLPSRAPPSRRNVAVLSHAEYVPTLTAAAVLRVKAALSKAARWPWPLTFWPWKLCPSHGWRGLPLCQFLSFWASLFST